MEGLRGIANEDIQGVGTQSRNNGNPYKTLTIKFVMVKMCADY